ncbi:MAG: glycosyltransferase [Chitinophagaceae bacterium]|nr:glycosyltransferase [Chitinophagaceae bacterium]
MNKKRITVSVISDLTTDQRVIRISNTLQQMGFEVTVIARSFKNSLPLDNYLFKAKRIRCFFRKGILQYAEFNSKLFLKLLFSKTDYFLANDLDVLIPNYIIGKCRGKYLFYDTHEYFTGVPELANSPTKKRIWKFFENWIFPKLPTVYTVNESVKNTYQQEYGNKIEVIRNVPVTVHIEEKELPGHLKNKTILLLQGAGINKGRGGIELLEAMKYLPSYYFLVMIGSGNQWNYIKEKRIEWQLENQVEMIEKLSPSELKRYTPLAHIGFSLDSFDDLNCLYNLPNKIFDYMHAGVPVIATAIPEVKNIIEQYGCGVCITDYKPTYIANVIEEMITDKEKYNQYKINCSIAAKELCWENESNKLTAIYQPFL